MEQQKTVPFSDYKIAIDKVARSMALNDIAARTLEALLARVEQAEAALAAMRVPCVWRKDDYDWWQLGCGNGELFVKQGEFCPRCGHPIEVQPDQEPAP